MGGEGKGKEGKGQGGSGRGGEVDSEAHLRSWNRTADWLRPTLLRPFSWQVSVVCLCKLRSI